MSRFERLVSLGTVFVLLALLAAVVVISSQERDPLAEFRQPDGSIIVPGGRFNGAEFRKILDLVLRSRLPPKPSYEMVVWSERDVTRPTRELEAHGFMIPNPNVYSVTPRKAERPSVDLTEIVNSSLGVVSGGVEVLGAGKLIDGLLWFLSFDWLIGRASAADRFLVLNDAGCTVTAIATDIGCWAATSGGAGGAGVPGTVDRALFDSASGTGTGTMDAAMDVQEWCSADACNGAATAFTGTVSTSNFALTIGTGGYTQAGTFTAGSSTITVSGNWNSGAGVFTFGTSTVVFAASGNLTLVSASYPIGNIYNLTVNASVTLTVLTNIARLSAGGTLTLGASAVATGVVRIDINIANNLTPISLGAGASISGLSGMAFGYCDNSAQTVTIPGTTYPGITFFLTFLSLGGGTGCDGTITNANVAYSASGDITIDAGGDLHIGQDGDNAGIITLVMGANNLTVQGPNIDFAGVTIDRGITFTSGALTAVNVVNDCTCGFFSWGSSTAHTVTGTWRNDSNEAASDAGTGTVTFASATGGTMTFAGANLAESEFNNVTFNSTGGTNQTFIMSTRGLRWGGTLSITDSSAQTVLTTSGLALNGGALTISTRGTVNASTSTVAISGLSMPGGVAGDLNITTGAWTINGDITMNGSGAAIVFSGAGSVEATNFNLSAASAFVQFSSSAWTISGTWTNATTGASWDAGTGSVLFNSAVGGTMTFAGVNLAEVEFNHVTFNSSAGTAQTFTMATRGLRLGGALVVNDGTSTTALDTSISNLSVTAGTVTIGAGGIFTMNGSTVTANGNWNSSAGTVTPGTSTLVFAANATLTVLAFLFDDAVQQLNNVTVNLGATVTLPNFSDSAIENVLTVNGTLDLNTNTVTLNLMNRLGSTGPLVIGGSGVITGQNDVDLAFWNEAGSLVNVPSATYNGIALGFAARNSVGGDGVEFRLAGAITVSQLAPVATSGDTQPFFVNTQTFDVTITEQIVSSGTISVGIKATSGNWSISASTNINALDVGSGFYIQFGATVWSVTAANLLWFNRTTNTNWDAGTGSISFSCSADCSTVFAGANLSEAEFNHATFNSSAGTAQVFTMATRGLRINGTLTLTDSSSITELNTSSLDVSADVFLVSSGGTLAAGTGSLLDATDIDVRSGTLTMDGFSVTDFRVRRTSGSGVIDITEWLVYDLSDVDIQWTMDPSVAGDTLEITIEGLSNGTFLLNRDTIQVDSQVSSGGVLTFSVTGGWSPHTMQIVSGGGAPPPGGRGEEESTWTWRHLSEDLTVILVVAEPRSGPQYRWLLGAVVIGEGKTLVYTFDRSGTYAVTLRVQTSDGEILERTQNVEAVALTFVGRYLPVLVLFGLAFWYVLMFVAGIPKKDFPRFAYAAIVVLSILVGLGMLQIRYFTIPTSGLEAAQLYFGLGLAAIGGALPRRKLARPVLMLAGLVFLFAGILSLIPSFG